MEAPKHLVSIMGGSSHNNALKIMNQGKDHQELTGFAVECLRSEKPNTLTPLEHREISSSRELENQTTIKNHFNVEKQNTPKSSQCRK